MVIAISPQGQVQTRSTHAGTRSTPHGLTVTRQTFGRRWRVAWCITYFESRHRLAARNGAILGPWQISVRAHPWANPWLLTHSWRYSARAAYRISDGGRDWYTAWIKFAPQEAACLYPV